MEKKNRSPKKALIAELSKNIPTKDRKDVNAPMKKLLSKVLKNGL